MFRALIGDLFESRAQTLVNTVNCVGVMGKGVAEQFKLRFPTMFEDYKSRTERKAVRLGEPYLYRDQSGARIINFPTKDHWRSSSRLADIEHGLDYLAAHATEWRLSEKIRLSLLSTTSRLSWLVIARYSAPKMAFIIPVRELAPAILLRQPAVLAVFR